MWFAWLLLIVVLMALIIALRKVISVYQRNELRHELRRPPAVEHPQQTQPKTPIAHNSQQIPHLVNGDVQDLLPLLNQPTYALKMSTQWFLYISDEHQYSAIAEYLIPFPDLITMINLAPGNQKVSLLGNDQHIIMTKLSYKNESSGEHAEIEYQQMDIAPEPNEYLLYPDKIQLSQKTYLSLSKPTTLQQQALEHTHNHSVRKIEEKKDRA